VKLGDVSAGDSVHVNKCLEKTDNADTLVIVTSKDGAGDRPPATPDFKAVATVFPGVPSWPSWSRVGLTLCMRFLQHIMKRTVV